MSSFNDLKPMIHRNKLLGMWAAGKLQLSGADADAYSDAMVMQTIGSEPFDVLKKIRTDFDAAGVAQSDEEILSVMNDLMLQAMKQTATRRGDAGDAAAVLLARKLTS
jgi:hypothetical protein